MKVVLEKEESDLVIEKKGIMDLVFQLENSDLKWLSDPNYLVSRYLLPNLYYPLKGFNNFKGYYEQILIEIEYAPFDHFNRGEN